MPLRQPKRMSALSPAHARSPKQEVEVAKRVGGLRVAGSGCGKAKGDCRRKGIVRVECKTTSAKSFTVTLEMLDKLETVAAIAGEFPVLVVEFLRNGKPWRSVCITTDSLLDKVGSL